MTPNLLWYDGYSEYLDTIQDEKYWKKYTFRKRSECEENNIILSSFLNVLRMFHGKQFPEHCGKYSIVCKITIGQPRSHQALRNLWISERYASWHVCFLSPMFPQLYVSSVFPSRYVPSAPSLLSLVFPQFYLLNQALASQMRGKTDCNPV
jgi:hypothetical protein